MFKKKKVYKISLIILILLLTIFVALSSCFGWYFFTQGFNNLDYLFIEILGNTILVGLSTYIATKSISTNISLKEFSRRNKIIISINKKNNVILNYKKFLDEYENKNSIFGLEKNDSKLFEYMHKKYTFIINTLNYEENPIENRMIETILNLPFNRCFFEDEKLEDSYKEIFSKFSNESILDSLLDKEDYLKLEEFSKIMQNIKHFEIANLNSTEGLQILLTANDKVISKFSCLPNTKYDAYMFFSEEKWIKFIAFSYDYNGKEEATMLQGFKYSNNFEIVKPANINLKKYMKVN